MNKLERPRDNRVIAGVCSAIGNRFNISITLVRVIFILLIILPPAAIIPYILLWIFIPSEESPTIQ